MQDHYRSLTQINLDHLVAALGLQDMPCAARVGRAALRHLAEVFARQMLDFDRVTGDRGLVEGARHAQRRLTRDVRVYGRDRLPAGGFLALSNHPGLTDTLALLAALDRADLKIIALERPFLTNLVNVSRHLFSLPDSGSERGGLVRQVARALRAGTAVLTFPAGKIEPDPHAFPGRLIRRRPGMRALRSSQHSHPERRSFRSVFGGVTWLAAARHPLVRIRRSLTDRQLVASALQLLWQLFFASRPVTVSVQIGNPFSVGEGRLLDSNALHDSVLAEMRRLIETPPLGIGTSVR